jgi:hypothetical protein
LVESFEGKSGKHDLNVLRLVEKQLEVRVYFAAVIAGVRSACPLLIYPIASEIIGHKIDDVWRTCLSHGWLETASQLLLIIQHNVGPKVARQLYAQELVFSALTELKVELVEEVLHYIHSDLEVSLSILDDLLRNTLAKEMWVIFAILCRMLGATSESFTSETLVSEDAKRSLLSLANELTPTAFKSLSEHLLRL